MGSKALRGRENWQNQSGKKGGKAELNFYEVLQDHFKNTPYRIREKPREFKDIYSNVDLEESTLSQIYNPNETWSHGIIPDYAIDNTKTNRTIYTEVKSQDGWVEGKDRKAGRGNVQRDQTNISPQACKKYLEIKEIFQNELFPFGLYFKVILHEIQKELGKFRFGIKVLSHIFYCGMTQQTHLS